MVMTTTLMLTFTYLITSYYYIYENKKMGEVEKK